MSRGVACFVLLDIDPQSTVLYVSASIEEILGFEAQELIGTPITALFHPKEYDQIQELRYQALANDKIACVSYCRYRHKDGRYLLCEAGLGVVFDKFVGSLRVAVEGPRTMLRCATAQEVLEISPCAAGRFRIDKWESPSAKERAGSILSIAQDRLPWEDLPSPSRRSCFFLNRFTENSTIMHLTNNVFYSRPQKFEGVPFYDLVRSTDRTRVREYIDLAKSCAATSDEGMEGSHHGYCNFGIYDDKDGVMEVQGIFTAYTDGLVCVIRSRASGSDFSRSRALTAGSSETTTSTDPSRPVSASILFSQLVQERHQTG